MMITSLSWFLLCTFVSISVSAVPQTPNISDTASNPEYIHDSQIQKNSSALSPVTLPHLFDVPGSQVELSLGFGWRPRTRRALDSMDMSGLIAVVRHDINEKIEAVGGAGHLYPVAANYRQVYQYELYGIRLYIDNVHRGYYFTWDILRDVVKGLWLFLIVGHRYRQTWFNFWYRPGTPVLGSGYIKLIDEAESSLDESK